MNDRAKQILIILIAARLIPWVQRIFGVTLSLEDIGDLFVLAVTAWHTAAASTCMVVRRYFPPPLEVPTQPAQPPAQTGEHKSE